MTANVAQQIQEERSCSGCGVCAAVCPRQNIEMRLDENGVLIPCGASEDCPPGCSLCLSICPFAAETSTDTLAENLFASHPSIQHAPETGYYLKALIGHVESETLRASVASGGFATAMLGGLLSSGEVDRVIAVRPTRRKQSTMLFESAIVSTVGALRQCTGSCYYPVSFEAALHKAATSQSTYAMIALPCVCRGVRLAQKINPRFRNIRYLLALTCGTGKSIFYTDYVAAVACVDPQHVVGIQFRDKSRGVPVGCYSTKVEYVDNPTGQVCQKYTSWEEARIGGVFCSRFFSPSACNFCDDVFGECADATFMDAWLGNYAEQPLGTSIALFRHPALLDRFMTLPGVRVDDISIDQVIVSQTGTLDAKRTGLSVRFHDAARRSERHPSVREHVLTPFSQISVLRRLYFRVQHHLSRTSPSHWRRSNNNPAVFWKRLWLPWLTLRAIGQLQSIPTRLRRLRRRWGML